MHMNVLETVLMKVYVRLSFSLNKMNNNKFQLEKNVHNNYCLKNYLMKVDVCVLFKLINVKHNVLIVDVFVKKKWIIKIKIKMRTIKKRIKSLNKINYIVVILILIKHNLKKCLLK